MSFTRDMDKQIAEQVLARYASIVLDEKMKALLLKLRKGADASVSLAQIFKVLALLGGWNVEKVVGLVQMHGYGGEQANAPSLLAETNEEAAKQKYEKLMAESVSKLPTRPEAGKQYVMDLQPFRSWDLSYSPDKMHGTNYRAWIGAPGYRITDPNGKIFEALPSRHNIGMGEKGIRTYEVLPWLKKETSYLQQISDLLGMETHEKERADKTAPRTRDNTGTCGVCFRNIKLVTKGEKKLMALHGYNRPGHGSIVGRCWGEDYPPYELSKEATEHYLNEYAKPRVEAAKKYLMHLSGATEFDKNRWILTAKPDIVSINDIDNWKRFYPGHKANAEKDVKWAEEEVKTFETLVNGWKLRPLPKEGELHIDWYLKARHGGLD